VKAKTSMRTKEPAQIARIQVVPGTGAAAAKPTRARRSTAATELRTKACLAWRSAMQA